MGIASVYACMLLLPFTVYPILVKMHEILNCHAFQWCKPNLQAIYRLGAIAGRKSWQIHLKKVSLDTTVTMSSSMVVKSWLKLTYWVGMYCMWHPGLHQVHHPKLRFRYSPSYIFIFSSEVGRVTGVYMQ